MARGPLFQNATTTAFRQRNISGNVTLDLATRLSENLLSAHGKNWYTDFVELPPSLLAVIRNSSAEIPVTRNYTGCDGECETKVNVSHKKSRLVLIIFLSSCYLACLRRP